MVFSDVSANPACSRGSVSEEKLPPARGKKQEARSQEASASSKGQEARSKKKKQLKLEK